MQNISGSDGSDQIIIKDDKKPVTIEKKGLTKAEVTKCKKLIKEIGQNHEKLIGKLDDLYKIVKYKEIYDFNVMLTTNNNTLDKIKEIV